MKELIDKLSLLLEGCYNDGKFFNTLESLVNGNHFIEVHLTTLYGDFDEETRVLLFYIYNRELISNREIFFKKRGSLAPNHSFGKKSIIDDFQIIQQNLQTESERCDEITKLLYQYLIPDNDMKNRESANPSIEYIYYDNVMISHEVDGAHADKTKDEIVISLQEEKIPTTKNQLVEGDWVDLLSEESKKDISHYNNNMCGVEKIGITPRLAYLFKIVEHEFHKHFIYNLEEIVDSAKLLKEESKKWIEKNRKKEGILIKNCKKIEKLRDKHRPGGLHLGYLVLFQLGLCQGLPRGTKPLSYMNKKQIKLLKGNEHIIRSIKRMGDERNTIVHVVGQDESTTSYNRTIFEVISLLEIFAKLNKLKKTDR